MYYFRGLQINMIYLFYVVLFIDQILNRRKNYYILVKLNGDDYGFIKFRNHTDNV